MMDSDGFAILDFDDMDINEMTLEEKILCGFFSARPTNSETYPKSMFSKSNPPRAKGYSHR